MERKTGPAVVVAALGLVAVVAGLTGCLGQNDPIVQPVAFSHATHVGGEEIRCKDCHEAEKAVHAGYPSLKFCDDCHSEAAGEHPDEPKLREYKSAKQEIPWVPVNRNAGHVYFSHRVHVALAELECESCHGDVKSWTSPPARPTPELHSMAACIDCHEAEGASIECIACHK